MTDGGWGRFVRDNFDKLLLAVIFAGLCGFTLYLVHHQQDQELILWCREMSGTVLGALLGLITGHALASRASTTTIPSPGGGATTTTHAAAGE